MRKPILGLMLLLAVAARADVVRLKNGNTLEGKIVEESARTLKFRTNEGGTVTILREQVAAIEKGESSLDVYTRRAAELGEGDAKGHLDLADYCLKHQLTSQGIAELRRVLALQADSSAAKAKLLPLLEQRAAPLLARAKALQDEGDYEQAEKPLIRILEECPEAKSYAGAAQHCLARGYAARKDYEQALLRWDRALKEDPSLIEAYEGAARAAIEMADYAQALRFTQAELERSKDSPQAAALRSRADSLRELAELAKAPKTEKPDPARLAKEGTLLTRLGLAERGLSRLEAAYQAGARDPELLKFLADHAEKTGRVRHALELCNLLAAGAPVTDDLVRRRARLERLLLIPKALAARTKAARERILFDITRSGVPFSYIEMALRECTERPAAPATGLVEGTFVADDSLARVSYACYVPKDYTPARPWPLILAFHRDGDTGKDDFFNWETIASTERFLVFLPTAPRKGTEWRFEDIPVVLSALRQATKLYHVDTNRVYLAGTLAGGELAWAAALRYPDRCAALVVRNAPMDEITRLYLATAVNLPVYQIASALAGQGILGTVRETDAALSKWNYHTRREEVAGARHMALPEMNPKVLQWLEDKVRDPYTPRVRLLSFEFSNAEAFWVRIDRFAGSVFDPDRKYDFRAPMGQQYTDEQLRMLYLTEMGRSLGAVTATLVPGNRINIAAKNVTDLTISLDDAMVDLAKPVSIYVNGALAHKGVVERSLDYLFESARRLRDPRLCYSARVQIKVK